MVHKIVSLVTFSPLLNMVERHLKLLHLMPHPLGRVGYLASIWSLSRSPYKTKKPILLNVHVNFQALRK